MTAKRKPSLNDVRAAAGGAAYHTYTSGEKRAFCVRLNQLLAGDPDLQDQLPMDPENRSLFEVVSKGVLLWYVPSPLAFDAFKVKFAIFFFSLLSLQLIPHVVS